MIHRRADDRQAERHVDGAAEGQQLDGDQPLVVITGDDDVEFAARGAAEDGVAGPRAGDVDAALRARASTAGRRTASSSSPITPCSPACGLSPASASRGAG